MNTLSGNTHDEEDRLRAGSDREITLGTTMILLIFFALAVYGAALFGFGYSIGNKHLPAAAPAVAAAVPSVSTNPTAKPSPGSPLSASARAHTANPPATQASTPPVTVPLSSETSPNSDAPRPSPRSAVAPSAASAAIPLPPAAGSATGAAVVVVQVAAVSHREDADLIATTLQRRGYAVNINSEPDKLLHVQVGPFSNRKDAEAMRARLLGDGFNAYIK